MVGVSACVNLPLHHKVQKFFFGTGSPGWSRNKGHKMVVVVVGSVETHRRCKTKHKMVICKKEHEKCLHKIKMSPHFVAYFLLARLGAKLPGPCNHASVQLS